MTSATCEVPFIEQRKPDAATRGHVTGILVEIYPEGVPAIAEEGSGMTALQAEALNKARALLPEELPAPLSQSCCSSGSYVRIEFGSDDVMYGPCDVPAVIDQVRSLVAAATYVKS